MLRVVALLLAIAAVPAPQSKPSADSKLQLRYGVAAFGTVNPLQSVDTLAALGFDYVEPALAQTLALAPEALAAARTKLAASGIRVETMNWFLPGTDIKLTGPQTDPAAIRAYVEKAL